MSRLAAFPLAELGCHFKLYFCLFTPQHLASHHPQDHLPSHAISSKPFNGEPGILCYKPELFKMQWASTTDRSGDHLPETLTLVAGLGPWDMLSYQAQKAALYYCKSVTSLCLSGPVLFSHSALLHLAGQRSHSWRCGGSSHISWALMVWLAGKHAAIIY